MSVGTIKEITYSRVPWLVSPTDDAKVDTMVIQTMFILQGPLQKSDADVEVESTYTSREKLLTGLYSAYQFVLKKVMENTGGTGGNAPTGNKIVKKAKADVTEVEFEIPKASDGVTVTMSAEQLLIDLKEEICNLAATMNIILPLCRDRYAGLSPTDVGANGFIFGCGLTKCGCK